MQNLLSFNIITNVGIVSCIVGDNLEVKCRIYFHLT